MVEIPNPYSAEHPAPPEKFAGRKNQITEFKRFLKDTINGNSKNIAVLGEWGIGKTSMLRMFKYLAEEEGCIGTIIELGEATDSFVTLFEIITQSLAKDARYKKKITTKTKEFLESLTLSVKYVPVGISYTKRKEIPPNIMKFREDLISIYKKVNAPYLIMLDNAEQLMNIKGSIFELRNIFQTLQSMAGVNCMLILAGRETLFADIRSASEPAARFFWRIDLEPFTHEETKEAIQKPLIDTPIHFHKDCIKRIHQASNGHPYFVQVFTYNLFNFRKNMKIDVIDLDENYPMIFDYLGRRLFETLYENISLNEQRVIQGFAKADKDILTNEEVATVTKVKSVNRYLKSLSEIKPPVLIKLNRGKYKLFHPLFKEYLRREKGIEVRASEV